MARKALIAGGILVAVVLVALKLLGNNVDSIVKRSIESVGSQMTGVDVSVGKVTLALREGRGEIGGLEVDNPKGFEERHAFTLGSVVLAVDPATVTKDVLVIRELTIEAPDVSYEDASNGSNIEVIQRNAEAYAKAHPTDAPKDSASEDAPRLIVESLQIQNGKVRLADIRGKDGVVDLPPVRMRNLGKREGGLTSAQLAQAVVQELTDAIKASAKQALADRGKERAKEAVQAKVPRRR